MYQAYKAGEKIPFMEEFPEVDLHKDEEETMTSRYAAYVHSSICALVCVLERACCVF
jgi:hypothetical protein